MEPNDTAVFFHVNLVQTRTDKKQNARRVTRSDRVNAVSLLDEIRAEVRSRSLARAYFAISHVPASPALSSLNRSHHRVAVIIIAPGGVIVQRARARARIRIDVSVEILTATLSPDAILNGT